MEQLSYTGLARQITLQKAMNVTANNLANMNTPGFKAQNMMFINELSNTKSSSNSLPQQGLYSTYNDISQGTLKQTYNPLDLALQGEGYFKIQTAQGVKYTRAGSFTLNDKREIVTQTGDAVLGGAGAAISIPEEATEITISADGAISTEAGEAGKLSIVTFANLQNVMPVGNNLFEAINNKELPVDKPQIEQGMLESSNVSPILEMNKMIEIQRMFQAAQNIIQTDHERQRSVIQKLTRV